MQVNLFKVNWTATEPLAVQLSIRSQDVTSPKISGTAITQFAFYKPSKTTKQLHGFFALVGRTVYTCTLTTDDTYSLQTTGNYKIDFEAQLKQNELFVSQNT